MGPQPPPHSSPAGDLVRACERHQSSDGRVSTDFAGRVDMTARRRLPHRRGAVALDIEHAGHRYRMHVGYFSDGAVGEVFLDAGKRDSTLDALAADATVLLSLLLQHGAPPVEIGHALRRSP